MKIGTKVRNTLCGPPSSGTVIRIMSGDLYRTLCKPAPFVRWNRDFPGWEKDLVVIVRHDNPIRQFTREEWQELECEGDYDSSPTHEITAYPVADLCVVK